MWQANNVKMWYWPIFISKIPKISKNNNINTLTTKKSSNAFPLPLLSKALGFCHVRTATYRFTTFPGVCCGIISVSASRYFGQVRIIVSVSWQHLTCSQIFHAFFFRLLLTCCFTATDGHQSSSVQNSFRVRGQLALSVTAPALRDGVSAPVMELHLCAENTGNRHIYILQHSSAQ